jgi:hypothetical protein
MGARIMLNSNCFIHIVLPVCYANYLLNNDPSNLQESEIQTIDEWIDVRGAEYDLFVCTGVSDEVVQTDQHALYSELVRSSECANFCFQIKANTEKYYMISKTLTIGEYEKDNRVLVRADCKLSAYRCALIGECHGSTEGDSIKWLSDDFSIVADMHGEMIYKVTGIEEVRPQDAKVLKRFVPYQEAENITDVIKYTDLVPLMGGGYSVGLGSDSNGNLKPALYDTAKEAQAEIDEINAEYQEQIEAGDRDHGDQYEGELCAVSFDGEHLYLLDQNFNQVEQINWRDQL